MAAQHLVAVVGGACAGSEIAARLRAMNMQVIVFEQNDLPYGKIEDGLPRWHEKLRAKEMREIDARLGQEGIYYVPRCPLGEGVSLTQLVDEWQIPLVVLAVGAWRDRPLKLDGVDQVQDGSFVYQNPLVYWFNHFHEARYRGPSFQIPPAPVVIGGGLASIDVAKICQFVMVTDALAQRGHEVSLLELEHYGIAKVCAGLGVDPASLAIKPARLFYRKRIGDMPLVPLGDDPSPEKLQKAVLVREKLVRNATTRYGFEVYPLHSPSRLVVNKGSVEAVVFEKQRFSDGRFKPTGEQETVAASLVISSIGSIPKPMAGIAMRGELYDTDNPHTGQLRGVPGVFCVGNAITGRGNIKESSKNAKRLASVIEDGLMGTGFDFDKLFRTQRDEARHHVAQFKAYLQKIQPLSEAQRETVLNQVKHMQAQRHCDGNYLRWRDAVLAAR